jgi:hypothetical protein
MGDDGLAALKLIWISNFLKSLANLEVMDRKSQSLSRTEALQKDHFAESVVMLTFLLQTFGLLNAPADMDI